MIDSTIVRARQQGAGASKKDDAAIGRSRGGLSSKIHTLVDALGRPLAFLLTAGQAHDLLGANALLPRMVANLLIADRNFDAVRRVLQFCGKGLSRNQGTPDGDGVHLQVVGLRWSGG